MPMKSKSLKSANTHLQDSLKAKKMRVRSIASSTAIETREPIKTIEDKLNHPVVPSRYRAKLA